MKSKRSRRNIPRPLGRRTIRLTRAGVSLSRSSAGNSTRLDGDQWFLLNRLDRQDDDPKPGRLTSDVIVWGPTKEHVDVLSASGAMWGEHAAITDRDWKLEHAANWPNWDDVNPQPAPDPRPNPDTPPYVIPADLDEKLNRILQLVTEIRGQLR